MAKRVAKGTLIDEYCGSPLFIAPEVAAGLPHDGFKADLWTLGVTLFIMIYGRYPFVSRVTGDLRDMAADLYHQILTTQPSFFGQNISQNLRDLFNRIFEKNPHKRITLSQILTHSWLATSPHTKKFYSVNFPPGGCKKSRSMENLISDEKIHEKRVSDLVHEKRVADLVHEKRVSNLVRESGSDSSVRDSLCDQPIRKRSSAPAFTEFKPKNRKEKNNAGVVGGRRGLNSLTRGQSCVF